MDRARQIAKYAKQQCCVCSKYGAEEPMCEPLLTLKTEAGARGLTLKLPDSPAIHDKCLRKLKELLKVTP